MDSLCIYQNSECIRSWWKVIIDLGDAKGMRMDKIYSGYFVCCLDFLQPGCTIDSKFLTKITVETIMLDIVISKIYLRFVCSF